jgi:very-short-patch-repair endonuclease
MLRRNATPAEQRLWNCVRAGQLGGLQFRRQFPIGGFIVDFCCRARRLVIELDGSQHADAAGVNEDRERTLRRAAIMSSAFGTKTSSRISRACLKRSSPNSGNPT